MQPFFIIVVVWFLNVLDFYWPVSDLATSLAHIRCVCTCNIHLYEQILCIICIPTFSY